MTILESNVGDVQNILTFELGDTFEGVVTSLILLAYMWYSTWEVHIPTLPLPITHTPWLVSVSLALRFCEGSLLAVLRGVTPSSLRHLPLLQS